MTWGKAIRIATWVLCWLAPLSALGQIAYGERPRWQIAGNAGISFTNANQTPLPFGNTANYTGVLGDMRLVADGFLLDPRFLHLNLNLNYARGVTETELDNLSNDGKGFAVNVGFLPRSAYPLRILWTRSDFGNEGFGLKQNSTDSRLDVEWNLIKPSLPHITVGFQKYSNTVHVPQSFSDQGYSGKAFSVSASDTWKGWDWGGNFAIGNSGSSSVGGIVLNSLFQEHYKGASFNLSRSFWDRRGRLQFENRENWRDDQLAGDGSTKYSEGYSTLTFDWTATDKLSTRAGFSYTHQSFNSTLGELVPGLPTNIVGVNSFSSAGIFGRVDYRLASWVRVFEDLRYTKSSPTSVILDSRVGQVESISGVSVNRRWKGFDVNAGYALDWQGVGTNLGGSANSFSNEFDVRLAWGNVRRVRLTALAGHNRRNLVEQIGGFSQIDRVRLEAESAALPWFRIRAGIEQANVELLNVGGDTSNHQTNFDATLDGRRFTATVYRTLSNGAGELFPLSFQPPGLIIFPLPIDQLIGSPLLDRNTQATGATLILRLKRRLDLSGNYRREHTLIPNSVQDYRVLEFRGRYRMGKVTLEGGYGRYKNLSTTASRLAAGTDFSRLYIRLGRDFTIF